VTAKRARLVYEPERKVSDTGVCSCRPESVITSSPPQIHVPVPGEIKFWPNRKGCNVMR